MAPDFSIRLLQLSDRLLGPDGERIGRHMVQAVLATVNGLVLVGLGEGALMGVAYILAGLPHPVSSAALTGVLAVIPFGAPLAFGAAALYLAAMGKTVAGIGGLLLRAGRRLRRRSFVRPVIIGGAARLPFLWVLLGILGGLETFGIIGLFLGPALMAALISLWRDWTDPGAADSPRAASGQPAVAYGQRTRDCCYSGCQQGCGPGLAGASSSADNAAPARMVRDPARDRKFGRMHEIRLRRPGGKTWFRIETEAEAASESDAMRHAVEKFFRKEHEKAIQSFQPIIQGEFRAGDRPQSTCAAGDAAVPDIARR